jgi:hypothetical protein
MGTSEIARNIKLLREKVASRCLKNGVDPSGIAIVGITKTFSVAAAMEALKAGLTDLGENKVQEAAAKIPQISPRPVWHLVGHLQMNKAKKAVELFEIIESVDSLELAQTLSNCAGKAGKKMTIFLQVNSSNEPQKSGFDPAEVQEEIGDIMILPHLEISGLMTIGPLTDDMGRIEKSFGLTRMLFEKIKKIAGNGFEKLSMGMSGDYEMALDYGANVLRIGTAIFGVRESRNQEAS